jgi:predicted RNA-binding protein
MIYINFICKIKESDKKTKISRIKFKNEEIKTEFLKKYKNYSFHLLNNENNIKIILRDNEDGFFFEKAIILDILTEKNDFN